MQKNFLTWGAREMETKARKISKVGTWRNKYNPINHSSPPPGFKKKIQRWEKNPPTSFNFFFFGKNTMPIFLKNNNKF